MAARIGLTHEALAALSPDGMVREGDPRVVFKEGDDWNISIWYPGRTGLGVPVMQPVYAPSVRELRFIAAQLNALADRFEADPWEEVPVFTKET